MAPKHLDVADEQAQSAPRGVHLSALARLAILVLGATVAIVSVLVAASTLQVLDRGGEVDEEDVEIAPIEDTDRPLTSLTNSFPALEDSD